MKIKRELIEYFVEHVRKYPSSYLNFGYDVFSKIKEYYNDERIAGYTLDVMKAVNDELMVEGYSVKELVQYSQNNRVLMGELLSPTVLKSVGGL